MNRTFDKKAMAPCNEWGHWNLRIWTGCLVAGDSFRCFFVRLGRSAVTVGVAVSIAIRRASGDRLSRVREIGRNRLRDVTDATNLPQPSLRLLAHQLLVNRADLGLLFVSL